MIRHARLIGPPAGDPEAVVAGLPVLLRQLLSLQDAGVSEVEVAGGVPAAWKNDSRLTLRITSAGPPVRPFPSLGAHLSAGPPELTAHVGLVWHPAIPKRLAQGSESTDIEVAPLEPGEFIVTTETAAARDRAESLLLKTLFKPTDGIVSRKLNRHISLQVTRGLLKWPVTPNQMTVIAALFGLAAIVVVAIRGTSGLIPGALLLLVQSILDGCDGEISRLKYLRSRLGEWLDQLFDDVVNLGYFAAVGYTLYRAGSVPAGWITLVGVISHLIYQTALYAALLTRGGGSGSVTSIRWWGQKAPTSQPAAGKRGIKQVV
ncbi:MAG TPA: CDP-alcohol phosphatidyltransferase family protein, partial [Gemmatimonadales bacterium]|nr:CDP-alcohol phosphatidyltransferase family protein [Gemmatimonadales bacterium]